MIGLEEAELLVGFAHLVFAGGVLVALEDVVSEVLLVVGDGGLDEWMKAKSANLVGSDAVVAEASKLAEEKRGWGSGGGFVVPIVKGGAETARGGGGRRLDAKGAQGA